MANSPIFVWTKEKYWTCYSYSDPLICWLSQVKPLELKINRLLHLTLLTSKCCAVARALVYIKTDLVVYIKNRHCVLECTNSLETFLWPQVLLFWKQVILYCCPVTYFWNHSARNMCPQRQAPYPGRGWNHLCSQASHKIRISAFSGLHLFICSPQSAACWFLLI